MQGTCQCTLITFTTPLPSPLKLYICHCTHCRAQTSSSYGLTALFPSFTVSPPYPSALGVFTRPNNNGETRCFFCTRCGVRLIHQDFDPRGVAKEVLSVKAGCLRGLSREMMRGAVHCWTRSAVVEVPEGVERYEMEAPALKLEM